MANGINTVQQAAAANVKFLRSGDFIDQITTGRLYIAALKALGGTQMIDGGNDWRVMVQVALNPSVGSTTAWAVKNVSESNEFIALDYEPRYTDGNMGISKGDIVGNMGEVQIVNLFKAKQKALATTLQYRLNIQLITGDATIATNTHGLPQLISTSGNVGGQSRSTYSGLQSYANGAGGALTAKTLDTAVNTIRTNCGEQPHIILTTTALKSKYLDDARSTMQNQRPNQQLADLGWKDGANHLGIPIIDDPNVNTGDMWLINTDYLKWYMVNGYAPEVTDVAELPTQHVKYTKILMVSNQVTLQPRSCGFLANLTG